MPTYYVTVTPRFEDLLRNLPLHTRVVIRYRIEGGFTDVLGEISAAGDGSCTVQTRRGAVDVPYDRIAAAKPVPPRPAPRSRRVPGDGAA